MATTILYLLSTALVLFLLPYVLGPVLVFFTQRMPSQYRFKLLDSEVFLSERSEIFKQLHQEIIAQEFAYQGSSELIASQSAICFSVYYSEQRQRVCTLMSAYSDVHASTQIELTQQYDDGCLLSVNNNAMISAYPKWARAKVYRCPEINNFLTLLALSDQLTRLEAMNKTPSAIPNGQVFSNIESFLDDELAHLIEIGWVCPKIKRQQHRLTIKGAVLMTWRMCWPVKSLIALAERH